jgi:hypothetical protein
MAHERGAFKVKSAFVAGAVKELAALAGWAGPNACRNLKRIKFRARNLAKMRLLPKK